MSIGENIRNVRKLKGFTMKQLGEMIGISEQGVGNYERGDRQTNVETLGKIAAALGVDISELLKGTYSTELTDLGEKEKELLTDFADLTEDHMKYIKALETLEYKIEFHAVGYAPGGSPKNFIYELHKVENGKPLIVARLNDKDFCLLGDMLINHRQNLDKTMIMIAADIVKAIAAAGASKEEY